MKRTTTSNYTSGSGCMTPSDTTNLIIEALAKAFEARVFVHINEMQQHPGNIFAVNFPNINHIIKTGQHYDLLKQIIDVHNVPCNDEEKNKSDGDC